MIQVAIEGTYVLKFLTSIIRHSIDIAKVYAQALDLFNNGFEFWLNKSDIDELQEHNRSLKA